MGIINHKIYTTMKEIRNYFKKLTIFRICIMLILVLGITFAWQYVIAAAGLHLASIFASDAFNGLSKKLGNLVFAKGKSGQYVRTRVKPTNPKTTSQMMSRQYQSYLSKHWKVLPQIVIQEWNSYAGSTRKANKLGVQRLITGFAWYMEFNKRLLGAGLGIITEPPNQALIIGSVPITGVTLTVSTTPGYETLTFAYTGGPNDADGYFQFFGSKPQSMGVMSSPRGGYRYLGKEVTTTASPIDLSAMYSAKFKKAQTNEKVFITYRTINSLSEEVSPLMLVSGIGAP